LATSKNHNGILIRGNLSKCTTSLLTKVQHAYDETTEPRELHYVKRQGVLSPSTPYIVC